VRKMFFVSIGDKIKIATPFLFVGVLFILWITQLLPTYVGLILAAVFAIALFVSIEGVYHIMRMAAKDALNELQKERLRQTSLDRDEAVSRVKKGWRPLVTHMYAHIPPKVIIHGVDDIGHKLRINVSNASKSTLAYIDFIEKESSVTCVECGDKITNNDSLAIPLCPKHKRTSSS